MSRLKKIIKRLLNFLTGRKLFRKKTPGLNSIHKILVISLYFKGDFLFHTAFLVALKALLPDSKIDLWLKTRLAEIAEKDPTFNNILIFDDIKTADYREKSKVNIPGKLRFLKQLRKNKYDFIVDLTGKYSTGLFTLLAFPKYSAGINYNFFGFCYDKFAELNTSTEEGHLIDKYLSLIPKVLNPDIDKWNELRKTIQTKPYLYIDNEIKEFITLKLKDLNINPVKPFITLHATSGWSAKEIDCKVFAELIRYFNSKQLDYIFIGDNGDKKKLEVIKSYLNDQDFDFNKNFLQLHFMQSVELIRRSSLFIGSDSAPLHAAGAVGTASIGIFGPTNPEFSKPVGKQHQVLYHKLYCSAAEDRQYCTRNGGFTCATVDCMAMINSNEIIYMIEKALEPSPLSLN